MIVDFPEPRVAVTVQQRWDAPRLAEHSPEFVQHYRLGSVTSGSEGELWCDLTVTGMTEDSVTISGRAGFAPTLPCDRCLKEGPLAVDVEVAVTVQHDEATGDDDKELDSRLLDVYSRGERTADLLQIAIDAVELGVPDPVSFRDDSGRCGLCGETAGDSLVATGGDADALNPFHALKGLKDKLKN